MSYKETISRYKQIIIIVAAAGAIASYMLPLQNFFVQASPSQHNANAQARAALTGNSGHSSSTPTSSQTSTPTSSHTASANVGSTDPAPNIGHGNTGTGNIGNFNHGTGNTGNLNNGNGNTGNCNNGNNNVGTGSYGCVR